MRRTLSMGLLATSAKREYREQIKACRETWVPAAEGAGIPVLFFGGDHVDAAVPVVNLRGCGEDYASAYAKQFCGLAYLAEHHPADFYFFGGSDNYVYPLRLLEYLQGLDPAELLYIGGHGHWRRFYGKDVYFHSGGAGFVASRALLAAFHAQIGIGPDFYGAWRKVVDDNRCVDYHSCDAAFGYYAGRLAGLQTVVDERFRACSPYARWQNESRPCCPRLAEWGEVFTFHYVDPPSMRQVHAADDVSAAGAAADWTVVTEAPVTDEGWRAFAFVLALRCPLVVWAPPAARPRLPERQGLVVLDLAEPAGPFALVAAALEGRSSPFAAWLAPDVSARAGPDAGAFYRALALRRSSPSFCCEAFAGEPLLAPTFFTGAAPLLRRQCELFAREGVTPATLEGCQLYYGAPFATLANYGAVRLDPLGVLRQTVGPARAAGRYALCLGAALQIRSSLKAGGALLRLADALDLCDEIFISAFYLDLPALCIAALDDIPWLAEQHPAAFDEAFAAKARHLLSNSDFLWPRVRGDGLFAVVAVEGLPASLVPTLPLVGGLLARGLRVLAYCGDSPTPAAFCHLPLVVRPASMPLPLPPEQIAFTAAFSRSYPYAAGP